MKLDLAALDRLVQSGQPVELAAVVAQDLVARARALSDVIGECANRQALVELFRAGLNDAIRLLVTYAPDDVCPQVAKLQELTTIGLPGTLPPRFDERIAP